MMSPREEFVTTTAVSGARSGGMNCGVYVVKSKYNPSKTYVEKRLAPQYVARGVAKAELEAMRQCKGHPTIIRLKDWDLDPYPGYGSIYMQYCELGSVGMLIKEYHKRNVLLADEGFLWQILWDMSLALCYLYNGTDAETVQKYCKRGLPPPEQKGWNKIIHRDIKPDNLFLTWGNTHTGYPNVVLGDFGLCVTLAEVESGKKDPQNCMGGTEDYKPPEYPGFGPFSDVYQLGIVLHCVGRMLPFPFTDRTELENYPLPSIYRSHPLRHLVKACLHRKTHERLKQRNLPLLVLRGYEEWAKARREGRKRLPSWALPGSSTKYC